MPNGIRDRGGRNADLDHLLGGRAGRERLGLHDRVVVDVGNTTELTVLRDGEAIPTPKIDPDIIDGKIGDVWIPLPPVQRMKVVSQTIEPGTVVEKGTEVDLVMAPVGVIPSDIFEDIHSGYQGKNIFEITEGNVLKDKRARKLLSKHESVEDLSEEDRTFLREKFQSDGIEIDDAASDKSMQKAWNTARSAMAFS